MREFNLEEAKAGKEVCDRMGNDIRIVCFDAKGSNPIIGLSTEVDDYHGTEYEEVNMYRANGEYGNLSKYDLMMKI